MRSRLKRKSLASLFPLLAVENDCIISKNAEVTVCYELTLPEVFTVDSQEYEAMCAAWVKAIKVLPSYTIVHKQDFFTRDEYRMDQGNESFLGSKFERHFHGRPYLRHECYLYLTKTTPQRSRQQSAMGSLCRGYILPKQVRAGDSYHEFLDAARQFEAIVNETQLLHLGRLTDKRIVGDGENMGLIRKYFSLNEPGVNVLSDIQLDPHRMRVGDNTMCLHTISDIDDAPQRVSSDIRYERLSTDRTDCLLSFASPLGVMLQCDHIYNQYIFIDDHKQTLESFEKTARNMNSLSHYSRSNGINKEWIDLYLNEAHTEGYLCVRCHFNVMAWSDDEAELKKIKNEVGSQISLMGVVPHHNTIDVPTLFWAGIPGNEGDFPSEETFYTFADPAVCFFNGETLGRSSVSPFGIRMTDRLSGVPIHLDITDGPMKSGIISNRCRFVCGPSGTGKSFFMNHLLRHYYEQGAHTVLIDNGNSYEGLYRLIKSASEGRDAAYFTYTEDNPVRFNPFFTADGIYDVEKRETIKTLLMTLWKREDENARRSEEVALSNAVNLYLDYLKNDPAVFPSFDSFYEYVRDDYREILKRKKVREKDFDLDNFLNVLEPFYGDGEYGYLLNSTEQLDLLHIPFVVFEVDAIKDNRVLFPVVTLIIMELFLSKMRRLSGRRKVLVVEEAWKAVSKAGMADFIKYLYKTCRKYYGETICVTQELDDILGSPIIKESIVSNSDTIILLDMRKYIHKFGEIQNLLGLRDKDCSQVLSINQNLDKSRRYKEVWISMGGVRSAVYAVEVSPAEYYAYTTEQSEKLEVLNLAESLGGDYRQAIRILAERKTNI